MKRAARLAGLAVTLTVGAVGLRATEHVEVRVTPQVAFAPANLNVRATIEADERNRAIEIVAESPDFYRSSEIQLDGAQAPRLTLVMFRDLPRGHYEVRAVVKGSRGQELATTKTEVAIVSQ